MQRKLQPFYKENSLFLDKPVSRSPSQSSTLSGMSTHHKLARLPYRLSRSVNLNNRHCRHASTDAPREVDVSSFKIPPESPDFIDIPRSLQSRARAPLVQKGILPRPREIHKKDSTKISREHLAKTTTEPTRRRDWSAVPQEQREQAEWKQRLAADRRRNLREGLVELGRRKQRTDAKVAALGAARHADSLQRAYAPEPDAARFTASTVLRLANEDAVVNRAQERVARRARFARRQQTKEEQRREALHQLYIHARSFITDEDGLDRKITEIFEEGFYRPSAEGMENKSVWEEEGVPHSIKWMLDNQKGKEGRTTSNVSTRLEISKSRQQAMAEELTGGKIGLSPR